MNPESNHEDTLNEPRNFKWNRKDTAKWNPKWNPQETLKWNPKEILNDTLNETLNETLKIPQVKP